MKKKWFALLLAAVVLTASTSALAATESKTTRDLTRTVETKTESGQSIPALIDPGVELSAGAETQLEALKSFVAQKKNAVDFFPDETKSGITALLPTGTDTSKLGLSEFIELTIGTYDASYGDVVSTLQFATSFTADQTVVVVIGYEASDGTMVWQALETTVVDGNLRIVFPAELMEKLGSNAVLAVLSD